MINNLIFPATKNRYIYIYLINAKVSNHVTSTTDERYI